MKKQVVALSLILAVGAVLAQATTPVGLWKTIDDETKAEKSLVRIVDVGGVLTGRVERIFEADKQTSVCEKCTDERVGKPVLSMTIIRNAKRDADKGVWEGGDILDPNNGKVYRLRLKPGEGGSTLEVRGYIGPFFRNQKWLRVE